MLSVVECPILDAPPVVGVVQPRHLWLRWFRVYCHSLCVCAHVWQPGQQSSRIDVYAALLLLPAVHVPAYRVVRQSPHAAWQQVAVVQQQHQQQAGSSTPLEQPSYAEVLQPAEDPLLLHCLAALHPEQQSSGNNRGSSASSSSSNSSRNGGSKVKSWLQSVLGLPDEASEPTDLWLPTRCLQLLEVLHAMLPNHTLLAADFDALPDVVVPGRNAPLVSGRQGPGVTVDYDTVLVPWGEADIFFPTDFDGLSQLYAAAARSGPEAYAHAAAAATAAAGSRPGGSKQRQVAAGSSRTAVLSSSHSSTADFMSAFAEAKQTRLLSGYNPLVQDWPNTRVFVGQSSTVG